VCECVCTLVARSHLLLLLLHVRVLLCEALGVCCVYLCSRVCVGGEGACVYMCVYVYMYVCVYACGLRCGVRVCLHVHVRM